MMLLPLMKRAVVAFCALQTAAVVPAEAEVITRCGASQGHAWYFARGLVSEDKAGWSTDGISDGQIILIRSGEKFDIIFSDASGKTTSARGQGGSVYTLRVRPIISLLVIYPPDVVSVAETYTFNLDDKHRGTVAWTTTKAGGLVDKAAVYTAECAG